MRLRNARRSHSGYAACLATLALVGLTAIMAAAPVRAEATGCYWASSWGYDGDSDSWYEYWYEVCEPDPPPPDPPPPDPPPPDPPPPPPPPPDPVWGCSDPGASNYNPGATANDGSCQYPPPPPPPPVYGCPDSAATNYDASATADNGSCEYPPPPPVYGCSDSTAINWNPAATADDGTCQYPPPDPPPSVNGCIDPSAANYDPAATADDGSCQYPPPPPPDGGGETSTCQFSIGQTVESSTRARLHVVTAADCAWSVTVDRQDATVLPSSGVGPGDIMVEIPESAATDAALEFNVAVYSAAPSDATSGTQFFGFPIRLPLWCRDSNSLLCRIVVVILPPLAGGGGSSQTCAVTPLSPLVGADAIAFENGQNVQLGGLTAEMRAAVTCLQTTVIAAGGMFHIGTQAPPVDPNNAISSAYRPAEYQLHLREVWDKWQALRDNTSRACQLIRHVVQNEVNKHSLANLAVRPAGASGAHVEGRAIDVNFGATGLTVANVVDHAATCNLVQSVPNDNVHFTYRAPQ